MSSPIGRCFKYFVSVVLSSLRPQGVTSADISNSDPPVDVDIDASSEELSVRKLSEARWKTSNTRFKNMFSNNEFGLERSVWDRLWFDISYEGEQQACRDFAFY
jgi:hypothetical protein